MTEPRTIPVRGQAQTWLDSWPEGATYVFTREQMRTVIEGAKIDARAEATAAAEQRLRASIEALPTLALAVRGERTGDLVLNRAAVLDLLLLGGSGDVGVPLRAVDGVGREVSVQRGQGVAVGQTPASRDATPSGTGEPVAAPGDARPALGASALRLHEVSVTHPSCAPATPCQGEPVGPALLPTQASDSPEKP